MQPQLLLSLPHPAIQAMHSGSLRVPNATPSCQACRPQGVRAHPSSAQASASFVFVARLGWQATPACAGSEPAGSRASTSMPRPLLAATRPAGSAAALM